MSKVEGKINKPAAIRDALQAAPKAKAQEIVETLKANGVNVTISLVYYIKSHSKKKNRKQKREAALTASRATGTANPVQAVMRVRALAMDLGGMKNSGRRSRQDGRRGHAGLATASREPGIQLMARHLFFDRTKAIPAFLSLLTSLVCTNDDE